MIVSDCVQGTPEWHRLRLGIPTASEFHRIVTPAKCELSKQSRQYMFRLVAEAVLHRPIEETIATEWIARGKDLERDAVRLYEIESAVRTLPIGFILTDDRKVGCSPDRLIQGLHAAVEIKCASPHVHLQYLMDGFGDDYKPQVQGQLWVGEFEWVDRFGYHPELPPATTRTHRDDGYITKLTRAVYDFLEQRDALMEKARALGLFEVRSRLAEDAEFTDVFGHPAA